MNLIILLLDEPVLEDGGGGAGGGVLALDLDGHGLVLLEGGGEVGLLGGLGGLGDAEGLDVALGVAVLDGCGLVGFQFLEVELLDEIGWDWLVMDTRKGSVAYQVVVREEWVGWRGRVCGGSGLG